ncbi:MAG: hypothetical protein ACC707_10470 [Thiohalomonadales bacterium]
MSFASIILIPLLAGYAFSISWAGSRYHVAREQGYHLYFRTGLYGVLLSLFASILHLYIVSRHNYILTALQEFLDAFTLEHTAIDDTTLTLVNISTITLLLGLSLGHVLNVFPWSRRLLLHIAIRNDDFERLVLRALRKLMPICVSMSNGKIYVGYVISTIDPAVERTALRILPLLSGYRDKDTNIMHFNTSYHEIYEQINDDDDLFENNDLSHLEVSDFEKVLPFNDIQSSHLFDIVAYQYFTLHDINIMTNTHFDQIPAEAIAEVNQAIERANMAKPSTDVPHPDQPNKPLKELR